MVIEQLPRDATVLATVVLVLMVQWKGVTCDNLRHSRETSWDDNILELETSREPFKNDEAFVGDNLQQELRGSEHSENADSAVGNQEIQQDLKELEPDLEDQLFSEGEGGARAQRTELETQDDQQVQLDELKDKDNGVDGSQHTRRESKERLELQQQQKEQKQQLDTLLGAEEGENRPQHAQQHQKSKHEENGAIKLRQARADQNDKQQLHQEKLTSAGKNTVVVRSVQPEAKEDQQLKQEQLPIGVKAGTGVPHGRLQTRDNHESQQEVLSKEGNSEVRAQHAPVEMEEVNWKLPHLSISNEERGGGGARSAELETKQKWGVQGQQLSNEVGAGKTNDHMKFGMEENHQQIQLKNEKRAEVVNYPSKMAAADVLQRPQNQFDAGAMSTQQGKMEAPDVRHLQQEEGKGAVGGQLDEEQQQLRQLAALGRIVESVRRNQEAGQQLKPNELLGHWIKPATARKEAALHNGPPSVEKLHPNENTLIGNSGHGQPMASERLVASKESEVPAAVKDAVQMSPSDTAEKDLMHSVGVGDDKPRTRESTGTIGSVGWRQPSKVAETEARGSGTRHGAEQWLQTAGSKSVVQELHGAGHRDRPAGVEKRQRPQGKLQGGVEKQHLRKPADGSHLAHVEVRKVKKRARNKATGKDQQRARRRGKGANRAQRQHQHQHRAQRQEFPNEEFEPDDVEGAELLTSLENTELPELPEPPELPEEAAELMETAPEELELLTATTEEGAPVGNVAVVIAPMPPSTTWLPPEYPESEVDLAALPATVPSLEEEMEEEEEITTIVSASNDAIVSASISSNVSVNTSSNISTSEDTNDNTGTEAPLPVSSDRDAVAQSVLQGVQRRAQQSDRLRQQILPALRSSPPPTEEAEGGKAAAEGGEGGGAAAACNESVACQRRRLMDRALRAIQQAETLDEPGQPCPAPGPRERACLKQLLQYAHEPCAGSRDLTRRIRHLRTLVEDYEKLTAAEKRQVQGVKDYLARQLHRLYSLSRASTHPPVNHREVREEPHTQQQQHQHALQGKEAAATALLQRLQRNEQLPPRPEAFQHRLQRRLASRHRRDAYAQLALSAADARFHMPAG